MRRIEFEPWPISLAFWPGQVRSHSPSQNSNCFCCGSVQGFAALAASARARAGDPPRADLAALGDELAQRDEVLVVDLLDLVLEHLLRRALDRIGAAKAVAVEIAEPEALDHLIDILVESSARYLAMQARAVLEAAALRA